MDSFLSDFIVDAVPDANARLALLLVSCGVAACALLFLFFVFSFFEHALFSLSKQEIEKINQSEASEFKVLKKMLKTPERSMAIVLTGHFLWAILICVSVCMAGVCCFSEFPAAAVFVASAFVAVLLLYAFVIEPRRILVEEVEVRLDGCWPPEWARPIGCHEGVTSATCLKGT